MKKPRSSIEVEPGEYASARAPTNIETAGLGACVGVIIYNQKTRKAYVGHFADPTHDRDKICKLLNNATKKVDMNDLQVWLGGGEIDPSQRDYWAVY